MTQPEHESRSANQTKDEQIPTGPADRDREHGQTPGAEDPQGPERDT